MHGHAGSVWQCVSVSVRLGLPVHGRAPEESLGPLQTSLSPPPPPPPSAIRCRRRCRCRRRALRLPIPPNPASLLLPPPTLCVWWEDFLGTTQVIWSSAVMRHRHGPLPLPSCPPRRRWAVVVTTFTSNNYHPHIDMSTLLPLSSRPTPTHTHYTHAHTFRHFQHSNHNMALEPGVIYP